MGCMGPNIRRSGWIVFCAFILLSGFIHAEPCNIPWVTGIPGTSLSFMGKFIPNNGYLYVDAGNWITAYSVADPAQPMAVGQTESLYGSCGDGSYNILDIAMWAATSNGTT